MAAGLVVLVVVAGGGGDERVEACPPVGGECGAALRVGGERVVVEPELHGCSLVGVSGEVVVDRRRLPSTVTQNP
jgi:hypothetical protein